ncbi:uncharacterized protein BYT42DRAFT_344067 [Radiomyces spectabilis]|uniref:uncharacterized protein n=1 Tax=Radiomyces spectabilis TaxID=64574 RepID=UPI00221FF5CC|nr:uncharacterized protein BYT42DRAFT_344067 [Radiomyces spectabilis]KAI8377426.1 hypothetical protein BYT42DRAFT_344067 [Radiomyces spectabilis]
MKSVFVSALAMLAAASQAYAAITVVTPWADSLWTAGGHGNITWTTTAAEANLKCEIQMLNGNNTNANLVAYVTTPGTPVDCSVKQYDIHPLNDFAKGKYWIRIGQSSTNTWAYSGVFNFEGKGTANPLQIATNGSMPVSPSGAAAKNAAAAASTTIATTGSSSGSKSSGSNSASTTPDNAAGQMSMNTKAMVTIMGAGVAALALL